MMQTFTDLAQRSDLLWLQRLSFCSSDYINLSQLQQHDQRLLQSVRLCQRYLSPDETETPLWLMTLLDNSAADLSKLLALPLALSGQWLLAELWLALQQKTVAHYIQQYNQPEQSQLLCLLARKPVASELFTAMRRLDLRSATQLAGQYGLIEHLENLRRLVADGGLTDATRAELTYSCYLLGQQTDEFALIQQLQDVDCLTLRQLQLILLAAGAEQKVRIINAFCHTDIDLAVHAMGFSGLTKFCPLLLEMAREPAHCAAAQTALITLLGAVTADSLLNGQPNSHYQALLGCNEVVVAGRLRSQLDLPALWVSGNQYQRFAASALQVLQQPGLTLEEPNSWRGGLWPVV